MITITKLGVKGIGPFLKPVTFEVPKGISYVYGLNHLNHSGNASGKTTLTSSLSEIFYDEPIVGTRQDRPKAGARFVEFVRGKKTIRVSTAFVGKSEKVKILVDGEDKSGRTNANSKEVISKLWPLSQMDFLTYGHLDNIVPHPLVRGTTTERKAFFTSFFGLDRLDAQRKLIAAELSKIKKVKAAYTELESTFAEVKKDMLPKSERISLSQEVESLERKVKTLRNSAEEAQRVKQLLEFEKFAGKQIEQLEKALGDKEIDELIKNLKKRIRVADSHEEQLEDYRLYRRELEKYNKATEGLDLSTPLSELKELSRKYQRALESSENKPVKPTKVEAPDEPNTKHKELITKQSQLEHALEHAREFKKGVCHACGQSVKAADPAKIKKQLAEVEEKLEAWENYDEAKRTYDKYKEKVKEYQTLVTQYEAFKKEVYLLEPAHLLYEKRRNLFKPEKVEKPADVEDVRPLKKQLEVLEFCQPHMDTIEQLRKLTKKERSIEFDSTALNKMQDRLSKVKTKLEVHNTVKARAQKMADRLAELKSEMRKEEALTLLLDGYSDKAVKKMVIEAISTHLMQTVNSYAPLVFEDYTFEFVWGTQIQIIVNRPKLGPSDVRKLSGAESKLFTLILLLALLKFVPKRKRLSLLILDEPTASFSDEMIELFHKLLPHLNQLIPSIVVVTPKEQERLEGATEYTVVRDKKGARLQKGHPSEI